MENIVGGRMIMNSNITNVHIVKNFIDINKIKIK
jgi:hypothetical protein